jgi:hypothetical protein
MAVTLTALSVNPGLMVQSVLLLDHTRAATPRSKGGYGSKVALHKVYLINVSSSMKINKNAERMNSGNVAFHRG